MIFDFTELSKNQIYYTMIQTIIPRPIAWVLSENENSSFNLAPFSYFNGVCSDPPLLMISVGAKPDGTKKDTWRNIEARKNFVVHIPAVEDAEDVTGSARPLAENESEIDDLKLQTTEFEGFKLPRLSRCRAAFGCSLEGLILLGDNNQAMILGRIHRLFVSDDLVKADGRHIHISTPGLNPLARLGGADFCGLTEPFVGNG